MRNCSKWNLYKSHVGQIQENYKRLELCRQLHVYDTPRSRPVWDLEYLDRLIFVAQSVPLIRRNVINFHKICAVMSNTVHDTAHKSVSFNYIYHRSSLQRSFFSLSTV
jgi:hypothetical protein